MPAMVALVLTDSPSIRAVLVSCAASILLLVVARILFAVMRLSLSTVQNEAKQSPVPIQWKLPNLASLPSVLPFELTLDIKQPAVVGAGVGVGMVSPGSELPINWQHSASRSQFRTPQAAIYQSRMPLSAAKIIMSRHTFRRPDPNRQRRVSTSTNRNHVPQQPTSSLINSIA
ncbi:hypothetical protein CONPUDRAFT_166356 [Coniophora puteana RWD-64-598 SS2]|uniref:Uncharacterized protein n=1 Tax=Coniophora puteana (strain RWD-64-598) TaxID=741705 RepID=A0A5M3MKM5_CONPW|nr:uncharacterized protein CONPUDRAFT_166356 [Coniophora puteana RWD-64-598 SS2]EIW79616.1 hypothetical protein CONPUDRAFT_166356 [Coniophora puteana RWD-64-598 SS2]